MTKIFCPDKYCIFKYENDTVTNKIYTNGIKILPVLEDCEVVFSDCTVEVKANSIVLLYTSRDKNGVYVDKHMIFCDEESKAYCDEIREENRVRELEMKKREIKEPSETVGDCESCCDVTSI